MTRGGLDPIAIESDDRAAFNHAVVGAVSGWCQAGWTPQEAVATLERSERFREYHRGNALAHVAVPDAALEK